ncbi:hypothetical protein, partial, partial [Absidia glauca]
MSLSDDIIMNEQDNTDIRGMKEIPIYNGKRDSNTLANWIDKVYRLGRLYQWTPSKAKDLTLLRLDGAAYTWARKTEEQQPFFSFDDLATQLRGRFLPVITLDAARIKLEKLKQVGSVDSYLDEFEIIASAISDLSPAEKLFKFKQGLKPAIREHVNTYATDGLTMEAAIRYAKAKDSASVFSRLDPSHAAASFVPEPMDLDAMDRPRQHVNQRIGFRGPDDRRRYKETRRCYNCGLTGHLLANCRAPKNDLARRLANEHPAAWLHKRPDHVSSMRSGHRYSDVDDEEDDDNKDVYFKRYLRNDPDNMCKDNGAPMPSDRSTIDALLLTAETDLPLYEGCCGHDTLKVLIDDGASASYLSDRWAHLGKTSRQVNNRFVETANGQQTAIKEQVAIKITFGPCSYIVQPYVFKTKFDLILGRDWLKQALPVPNWLKDTWTIKQQSRRYTLYPSNRPRGSELPFLVSAMQTKKLVRKRNPCFMVTLNNLDTPVAPDNKEPWRSLPNEYPSVFRDDLPGLPPHRDTQHAINTGDARPVYRVVF